MSALNVTTKTWVTSALSAAEMVSFTIPGYGPLLAAGEAVANFLVDMFWNTNPAPDPLQTALNLANQDLGSQLNITIANFDDLLNYMATQEQDDIQSTDSTMHENVYDQLTGAVDVGDSGKVSSQLTNMENAMLAATNWREQFLILNAYVTGVGVELLCYAQLILVEALTRKVPNALQSGFISDLNDITLERTGKLSQAAGTTNENLMAEMEHNKDTNFGWQNLGGSGITDWSNATQVVAGEALGYNQGLQERIMGGPVFSDATIEYTDSILKLNQALTTASGWQQQAQTWVQAAASAG